MDNEIPDWLYHLVNELFSVSKDGQVVRQKDIHFELIKDVNGFMSHIYRVHLNPTKSSYPETIIVKRPYFKNVLQDSQEDGDKLLRLFSRTEWQIYNFFQKVGSPVSTPKIYYNSFNEEKPVIVMEDLSKYKTMDVVDGLADKQVFAVVDALVDLHVYAHKNKGWIDFGMQKADVQGLKEFSIMVSEILELQREISPEYLKKSDEILKIIGKDGIENFGAKCRSGEIISTLVHGDLWTANLLWDGDELKGIIDWQLVNCGSIMQDLVHVLAACVTTNRRRQIVQHVIEYYYSKLKEKFSEIGDNVPFTFSELMINYHQTMVREAVIIIFAVIFWNKSGVLQIGSNSNSRTAEMFKRADEMIVDALASYELLKKEHESYKIFL